MKTNPFTRCSNLYMVILINLCSSYIVFAQCPSISTSYNLGDVEYIGRFVDYGEGNVQPAILSSGIISYDPVSFFAQTFQVNIHASINFTTSNRAGFINAYKNAINSINATGSLLQLSEQNVVPEESQILNNEYASNVLNEHVNTIGFEDQAQEFFDFQYKYPPLNQNSPTFNQDLRNQPGLAVTIFHLESRGLTDYYVVNLLDPNNVITTNLKSDCTKWFAPNIVGFDILINPNYRHYFHGNSTTYTDGNDRWEIESIIVHEMLHGVGLKHFGHSQGTNIMNPYLGPNTLRYDLNNEALTNWAIRRLYGCDGMINSSDPKFSSIPCEKFKPIDNVNSCVGFRLDGPNNLNSTDYSVKSGVNPCNNCVMDNNEDGIDCGGYSCSPCEQFCSGNGNTRSYNPHDEVANSTIVKEYIVAGEQAYPGEFFNIGASDGQAVFKAGEYIEFNPGVSVDYGSHLTCIIGDCDYRDICDLQYYPNVFTPNCDGVNDWFGFWVNGATSYEFWVIGQKINGGTALEVKYHGAGPVFGNFVRVWDGKTLNPNRKLHSNHLYYLVRFFNQNLGTVKGDPIPEEAYPEDFHYFFIDSEVNQPCDNDGGLSAPYPKQSNPSGDDLPAHAYSSEELIALIEIYPNPSTDIFNIFTPFEYNSLRVFDFSMKQVALFEPSTIINLSHLPAGIYFIQFVFADKLVTKKIEKL